MSRAIDWKKIKIKELALLVGQALADNQLEAVLVGGACVSIYSHNRYVSGDLDLISYDDIKRIRAALAVLGFSYTKNRYYTHPHCPYFLEFISPPVAIGREPVAHFNTIRTSRGQIKLLTPTDCVKDRLAAYFHWNDRQSLEQAVMVAKAQKVNLANIKKWSKAEGFADKYAEFLQDLQ
jgi:hypothetical protein